MKILQISYSLSSGGAERFVVDLCNRLALDKSNEVVLVTTDDEKMAKNVHYLDTLSKDVRFVNLHCKSGHHPLAFWRLFKTIKREKPDIVHAHCNMLLLYLPAILSSHIHFVHTLHNLAHHCLIYRWCKFVNRWLYQNRVQAVTISKECNQSYIDLYDLNTSICITNGREPLVPSGIIPTDVGLIKEQQSPIFIHVARFSPQKNQKRLFRAFERLQADGIKYQLLVIGNGYGPEIRDKYKNNSRIHIIGERKNVADYMALADFFVLSSDIEGLPLTLLEAMSIGVIPICTPAGGCVDVIRDGENGYMPEKIDDELFYEAICRALKERRHISPSNIIKEYKENYSMKVCAEKYFVLYKKMTRI